MNIGEAAREAGLSAKSVRHYESIGLLPAAPRTPSGYRVYSGADIHRLRFIRRARTFGLPMERIRALLALWEDRGRASGDVKRVALAHVEDLRRKVAELTAMADTLQELAERCEGGSRPDCPILRDLADGQAAPASRGG
ncbi:Cu(I)-responsive transcriptional regulator [Roseomonas sp. OT10]|uniref:Cu(I)-responsive transcriptional regulator n=1 Tax=Roseomonas cutis TaxID=2897332 RepID=UPI001E380B39|nr:Cu(I)-responsive transcriptional regulator [Roseomonas sp. OT10]UFN47064.1 Cu(I)-responsive transcriptional regulator [Roseomonas sp. OT10]